MKEETAVENLHGLFGIFKYLIIDLVNQKYMTSVIYLQISKMLMNRKIII